MTTAFRPSCVVNIRLIFDEALRLVTMPTPRRVEDEVDNPPPFATVGLQPLLVTPGSQNVSFITGRIPYKASYQQPGHRQAGQFTCEFDFKDLPIDPRTVRAASVEIHLGAVSDDDFVAGMQGTETGGGRRSVLRTRTVENELDSETLRMIGMVDEWSVEHSDKGSTVTLKGRDSRGILLDTPINVLPNAQQTLLDSLDLSLPLDKVITNILEFNPLFQEFKVVVNPAEWPNGTVPAPQAEDVVPRHRRGARRGRSGGRGTSASSSNDLNFWDLIVQFSYLCGAIPYFRGSVLFIRPVRALYDQQRAGDDPMNPTPFAGGLPRATDSLTGTGIEPSLRIRRLVYGRDIEEMTFDRKFGGFRKPQVIRCVSVNGSSTARGSSRLLVGTWPIREDTPTAARRTRVAPGGQQAQEEILTVPCAGITNVQRLQEIARAIYEEIGRGELGGSCTTRSLASFGGTNSDPDLLKLFPGDAVEFLTDISNISTRNPNIATLTDHERNSFEDQVRLITDRIGDENLARVIVATSRNQVYELQRRFRVQNVKMDWSDKGLKISFDFQNFVEVRNDIRATTDSTDTGAIEVSTARSRRGQRRTILNRPSNATQVNTGSEALQSIDPGNDEALQSVDPSSLQSVDPGTLISGG